MPAMPPASAHATTIVVLSQDAVPSASGTSVGTVKARARTVRTVHSPGTVQGVPGSTLASTCLTLFFTTLPNSGSVRIMETKFRASLNVMCGGNGGMFGSA